MSQLPERKIQVLAIETSCDDTSVAIVDSDGVVSICLSADQNLVHAPFGGVVPEIASRNHTMHLLPLIEQALKNSNMDWSKIDAIAVTARPGLIGSLMVGVVTAKSLSQVFRKPLIGVNHLEGHILAPFLKDSKHNPVSSFKTPFVSLAVSGGHTSLYFVPEFGKYQVLGTTRDDAAGEAYDKFGQMLGLGFPGGVNVDRRAQQGDSGKYNFPRTLLAEDSLDFSFSGLKSAAARQIRDIPKSELENEMGHLCASFQEAIADVLILKLELAVKFVDQKLSKSNPNIKRLESVSLTGGVAANSRLRARAEEWALKNNLTLAVPPLRYCTDNAAMIGFAGALQLARGFQSDLSLAPMAQSLPGDFVHELV